MIAAEIHGFRGVKLHLPRAEQMPLQMNDVRKTEGAVSIGIAAWIPFQAAGHLHAFLRFGGHLKLRIKIPAVIRIKLDIIALLGIKLVDALERTGVSSHMEDLTGVGISFHILPDEAKARHSNDFAGICIQKRENCLRIRNCCGTGNGFAVVAELIDAVCDLGRLLVRPFPANRPRHIHLSVRRRRIENDRLGAAAVPRDQLKRRAVGVHKLLDLAIAFLLHFQRFPRAGVHRGGIGNVAPLHIGLHRKLTVLLLERLEFRQAVREPFIDVGFSDRAVLVFKAELSGRPGLITVFFRPRDARIGIIGRNGAGKSTFLRMLTGEVSPDSGSIIVGDTVKIGYFSQECESMDPRQRVIDYIRETAEIVRTPEGNVTAAQMLERFLFNGELQWNCIEKLSGGERKRLYLLKILMTAPNILLLDEPTNDLDILTLTILEEYLQGFDGAVLAVSHDRYFLDKLASELFVFRNGSCIRYNGNYSDNLENLTEETVSAPKTAKPKKERVRQVKLKFSFKEQREYDHIEEEIAALEAQIADTDQAIQASGSDYVRLQELTDHRTELEAMLDEKMERWVYLNDLAERIRQGETYTG